MFHEDPHIRRGYEVGGMDYFTKPFNPDILKKKIAVYASFRMKSDVLRERERHIRGNLPDHQRSVAPELSRASEVRARRRSAWPRKRRIPGP